MIDCILPREVIDGLSWPYWLLKSCKHGSQRDQKSDGGKWCGASRASSIAGDSYLSITDKTALTDQGFQALLQAILADGAPILAPKKLKRCHSVSIGILNFGKVAVQIQLFLPL